MLVFRLPTLEASEAERFPTPEPARGATLHPSSVLSMVREVGLAAFEPGFCGL